MNTCAYVRVNVYTLACDTRFCYWGLYSHSPCRGNSLPVQRKNLLAINLLLAQMVFWEKGALSQPVTSSNQPRLRQSQCGYFWARACIHSSFYTPPSCFYRRGGGGGWVKKNDVALKAKIPPTTTPMLSPDPTGASTTVVVCADKESQVRPPRPPCKL